MRGHNHARESMKGTARYRIQHISRYRYSAPVQSSAMTLCFKPRDDGGQSVVGFDIETEPEIGLTQETDYFGNTKHYLILHKPHESLEIVSTATVEVANQEPVPDSVGEETWEALRGRRDSVEHWVYTHESPMARPSPQLEAFMSGRGLEEPSGDPLNALKRLSNTLHESFEYMPGSTSAISPIEEILQTGKGVCQDYAHVMITVARGWGVPTRYVSGYLYVEDDTGNPIPSAAGHAWVECLVPGLGWVGLDPTNNWIVGERHVRVAVGRDYRDVSPTRGVMLGAGETRLEVEVRMESLTPGS